MTVSCTVTGSGLGSGEEALCEEEVKKCGTKGLAVDGIAVGRPIAGKMVGNNKGAMLVGEEEASGDEVVPRGQPGKGWVLTA